MSDNNNSKPKSPSVLRDLAAVADQSYSEEKGLINVNGNNDNDNSTSNIEMSKVDVNDNEKQEEQQQQQEKEQEIVVDEDMFMENANVGILSHKVSSLSGKCAVNMIYAMMHLNGVTAGLPFVFIIVEATNSVGMEVWEAGILIGIYRLFQLIVNLIIAKTKNVDITHIILILFGAFGFFLFLVFPKQAFAYYLASACLGMAETYVCISVHLRQEFKHTPNVLPAKQKILSVAESSGMHCNAKYF